MDNHGPSGDSQGENMDSPVPSADTNDDNMVKSVPSADTQGENMDNSVQSTDTQSDNMDYPVPSADTQGDNMDNPVPRADSQGDNIDNLGASADTQGDRIDNPGTSADTQGDRIDNPGTSADTQGDRIDNLGTSADTQGDNIDNPGTSADTQGDNIDNLGTSADTQGDNIDNPGTSADTQGDRIDNLGTSVDTQGDNIDNPGTSADTQGDNIDNLGTSADTQGDNIDNPGTSADTQGDNIDNLGASADTQGDRIDNIGTSANTQGDNIDNPGTSADTQGDRIDNLGASADTQGDRIDNIGTSANTQGDNIDNLGTLADTQGDRIDNPGTSADTQGDNIDNLGASADTQGDRIDNIGTSANTQGDNIDNPGTSADTQGDRIDNLGASADTQGDRIDNIGTSANTQGDNIDNLGTLADTQGDRIDNPGTSANTQGDNIDNLGASADAQGDRVSKRFIRDPRCASGYREADDAYNKNFEEYFSNYKEEVHKVPHVNFGNHPSNKKSTLDIDETETVYLDDKAESDTAGEMAEKSVADFIERKLLQDLKAQKGPAFLIMNYKFKNFCNRSRKKPIQGEEDGKNVACVDGEHDILIVHYKYGVIFIQVKSTQAGTDPNQTSAIAIKQTEKDEKFFQENFVDLKLDISISSVISLPDINERDLEQDNRKNCKKRLSDFGLRRCLFKNHLQNETTEGDTWWNEITKDRKGFDSFEDYKRVIARYIGYKSTVEIPVVFHQKPLYKTPPDGRNFSDAVATMGNRYVSIVLTPGQIYVLTNDFPRLVIHGNFGSGKTVLLILKVRRLLRKREKVCVITMCSSSLKEVLEESIKHNMDLESVDSLIEFAQAHEESELSKIILKCAETKRHVFIDEFPSFIKTDKALKAAIKQFPEQLMFWCITGRERYMKLSATVNALFDEQTYFETSQHSSSHPVACSEPPSSRNQEISATGLALEATQYDASFTGSSDHGKHFAASGEAKSEAMPVPSWSGGQVRNAESGTAIPQPTGHGFIRFFMSKILRCPPTVYSILPTMQERAKGIACYDKCKLISYPGTKKKVASHFHSLGLYTSETLKFSQERPEYHGLEWADIVVVDKTLESGDVEKRTTYTALVDLEIPLVTSAGNTFDNKVLFAVKDDFKGLGRRELIVFGEKMVIANPVEKICMEGPDILHVDHTKHNAVSLVCCDCENEIRNIIKKLDLHVKASQSMSGNVFTPGLELTVADVVIIDTRQEPKCVAHLFQKSNLEVVDKLEAEAVDMTDMFSPSKVMQIKPKMIAGLEKKVVFVVRSQSEKLVSNTRRKAIVDPAMLAFTRYTSQLVIITMDSSAPTN